MTTVNSEDDGSSINKTMGPSFDVDAFRVLHPMLYTSQFLKQGYRTDGRTYTEQRELSIARGKFTS